MRDESPPRRNIQFWRNFADSTVSGMSEKSPSKSGKVLDKEAQERLAKYNQELRRKRQVAIGSGIGAAVLAIGVVMYLSGRQVAAMMGLDYLMHEQGGIYADCTKRENRSSPFCTQKDTKSDRDWKGLQRRGGKLVPFSLYEKK